jgi:hypothetical protein
MATYEDDELDELMNSVKETVRNDQKYRDELKAAVESKSSNRVMEVITNIVKWLFSDVLAGIVEAIVKHLFGWQ